MKNPDHLPSTVLFDLDGTLVNSLPDVTAALNYALEHHMEHYKEVGLRTEEVRLMIGQGAEPMIKLALKSVNQSPNKQKIEVVLDRFLKRYAEFPNVHSEIYPGVLKVLDFLKSKHVKLGICTNKPQLTTKPVLAALGLERYFDAILCGDQVEHQKPDPRHLLEILNLMKADKTDSIFIGDSDNDIDAAKNAKIPSVAVSYGYCKEPIESLGADVVIDRFEELPDAIVAIRLGL